MAHKGSIDFARKAKRVNEWGRKTVDKILSEPSLENFLSASKEFAVKTGFATERVKRLMSSAESAGAIGATQNMLGEAVHALVKRDNVKGVVETFGKVLPPDKIVETKVSLQGAQLVT